jgi:catechol 2,3-dioxygenase-like lactoylglutathione lyase family enzyme
LVKGFNYPVNHIAISVPDANAASKWYVDMLGFTELKAPAIHDRAVKPDANIFKIYPADLNKATVRFLSAGNGVGIELFEFQDPKIEPGSEASFEKDYKRGGFFHFAVTVDDIRAVVDKVAANGGKTHGPVISIFQYEAAYVQDPWGNVIELLTASFERVMANRSPSL